LIFSRPCYTDGEGFVIFGEGKEQSSIAEIAPGSMAPNISRFAPCFLLLIPPADRICQA